MDPTVRHSLLREHENHRHVHLGNDATTSQHVYGHKVHEMRLGMPRWLTCVGGGRRLAGVDYGDSRGEQVSTDLHTLLSLHGDWPRWSRYAFRSCRLGWIAASRVICEPAQPGMRDWCDAGKRVSVNDANTGKVEEED